MKQKCSRDNPHFISGILISHTLKLRFSNMNDFFASLFYCEYDVSAVWCHCLGSCKGASSFTSHWFYTISANTYTAKIANILVLL